MKKLYNWAVKLPIIRNIMQKELFQKLFSYEVFIYLFFGVLTTAVNLVALSFLICFWAKAHCL